MLGIFLDTETNGLNPVKHKTIEIAFMIVNLYDGKVLASYESLVHQNKESWKNSDLNSLKVNGFTHEMISNGKSENKIKEEIIHLFSEYNIDRKSAVFICQNPSFDRAFFSQIIDVDSQELMKWPYHWLDLASMFFAKNLPRFSSNNREYPWEIGLSKDSIAYHYHLPEEIKPHRAMNGVNHLLLCYNAVVGFPIKNKK